MEKYSVFSYLFLDLTCFACVRGSEPQKTGSVCDPALVVDVTRLLQSKKTSQAFTADLLTALIQ